MIKRVLKISRHIMWNWEKSPEEELVRYHIIVVNDKNRKGIMNEIIGQFQKVSSGIECIRTREGNVKNSKLKYLFESYDSSLSPSVIDWVKFKSVKRNKDLYERQRGNIENYVADFYEG